MSDVEREAFDEWYVSEFNRQPNPASGYESDIAWKAWQARAQSAGGAVPEPFGTEVAYQTAKESILTGSNMVISCDLVRELVEVLRNVSPQQPAQGQAACAQQVEGREVVAWVSPGLYGSKLTFQKPEPPEGWEDYADDWYCQPLYTNPAKAQGVPDGENDFGLDARYFHEKLRLILRDINSYTPTEMARALGRLAVTANSETMREPEFNIGDLIDEPRYRDSTTPPSDKPEGEWVKDVVAERIRQDQKWGGPEHDDQKSPNDFVQHIEDYAGWARVMAGMGSFDKYRRRMVQVAALAGAAIEASDRAMNRVAAPDMGGEGDE